jgi:WD40 repeat protein
MFSFAEGEMAGNFPPQGNRGVLMKLTGRMKWGIATVTIPILAAALLYVYAILPEKEDIPPSTGEVREVAPSWFDRALSAWYERKTDEPIVAIIRQEYPAQTGAISPDGKYIATGGSIIRDTEISSVADRRVVRELAINSGNVLAVAFSPDGRYLATGRGFMASIHHNESVEIWDVQSGRLIRKLPGPAGPEKIENDVTALTFSPDSRSLAVSYSPQPDKGNSVHLFDLSSGKRVLLFHPSRAAAGRFFFFNGGSYLGYEDFGGNFNLHELSTGKRKQRFPDIGICALSPDGQYLAARSNIEQKLKIIDRKTGREVQVMETGKGYYRVLAYSPDGHYLAVNSDDGLLLWDLSAGRIARQLKGHPGVVGRWIGFDAGGRYLAAVCNKYVVVWDFQKLIEAGQPN